MDHEQVTMAILFGFILVSFVYLGWTHRTSDDEEYHTVHRMAGFTRILSSCFTVVGASEFVVFVTLTYIFGIYSILFFIGTLLGFYALSMLAKLIRKNADELDEHSIPDFAANAGFPVLSVALSILSIVFTACLVLIQLIIGGILLSELTGESIPLTTALLALAVFGYLYWGGYRALLFTDIVQGILLFAFTFLFAFYLSNTSMTLDYTSFESSVPLSEALGDYFILLLGGFFAIFGGPEIWQRVLTSNSINTASKGLRSAGWIMLLWGAALIVGAVFIKQLMPEANPDTAFMDFISTNMPEWLLGVMVVLLLAAIISTADTEVFAAAVITQKEINRYTHKQKLRVWVTRLTLFILLTLIVIIALKYNDILSIYFGLVYITFITGPFALALVLKRGNKILFLISLLIALMVYGFIFSKELLISWYPILIMFSASIPLLVGPSDKKP